MLSTRELNLVKLANKVDAALKDAARCQELNHRIPMVEVIEITDRLTNARAALRFALMA